MTKTWAKVAWTVGDVQTLFNCTDAEAADFLTHCESSIQDRLIEVGWGVLDTLGIMHGLKRREESEEEEDTNDG